MDISLDELSDKIASGHTFSGVYDHEGEWEDRGCGVLKDHYVGSYSINIDIDHQQIPIEEKLSQISIKPTIAYRTFSDKEGDYSYRFIYAFNDMIVGSENYKHVYDFICNTNDFEYDTSTRYGYKLMHGTDKQVFLFDDNVYRISDFAPTLPCPNTPSSIDYNINGDCTFIDDEFKKDYFTMTYSDIVDKYRNTYRNYEHNIFPKVDEDTPVIDIPDNWYEITRVWNKTKEAKGEVVRIKNHHHRRINLYRNLIIRRLICPELTFDELVYDLCYEMSFYIDNTDKMDYITKNELVSIAENALVANPSQFNYKKPRKSIVNYKYMLKYNKTKIEVRNKHNAQKNGDNKSKNDEIISRFYNTDWSIRENIEYIEDKTGIKFSERKIKNWKKENGLTRSYCKHRNEGCSFLLAVPSVVAPSSIEYNINGDCTFNESTISRQTNESKVEELRIAV